MGVKIAISGPGRSGTSLLVRLFEAWGMHTVGTAGRWSSQAQAGLESPITGVSPFEVDKDPMAFEYLHQFTEEELAAYDLLIVPIRRWEDVAVSRSSITT